MTEHLSFSEIRRKGIFFYEFNCLKYAFQRTLDYLHFTYTTVFITVGVTVGREGKTQDHPQDVGDFHTYELLAVG